MRLTLVLALSVCPPLLFPALRVEEIVVDVQAQVGGDFPHHVVADIASKPNAVQRIRPARGEER